MKKLLNEKAKSQEYMQNDAIYVKMKNSQNQMISCSQTHFYNIIKLYSKKWSNKPKN
jgi:hypothetical protein